AYGSELARHLNLTTATVSHHMNALLSARLVEVKREEKRVYYTANKKALEEVLAYCRDMLV
ncbi:MAG: ArsR family transcriptional regulator, partial [Lachnospiraceae bacterium]|nr:ArsR family transcriptional regulator [Lachnospiraceae bacterium]